MLAEEARTDRAFNNNRAVRRADLKFVVRTFADAGKEQFPDAAAEQLGASGEPGHPSR